MRKIWVRTGMAAIAAFAVWWSATALSDINQLRDAHAMSEELFKPEIPQTVCFGRMLLELPKDSALQWSVYWYPGAYKEIEKKSNISREKFQATIKAFEQYLKNTEHEKDSSLFKRAYSVPNNTDASIFIHWENDYSEHLTTVTGFARLADGTQYKLSSEVSTDFIESTTHKLIETISHLRSRSAEDIPSEHGFCLDNAFIADQLKGEELERAEVYFELKPWVGTHISVKTFVNQVKEPTSLLERLAIGQKQPWFPQAYSLIREGKRSVGELHGEEVLVLAKEEDDRYFHFMWEVEAPIHRNDPPDIKLELRVSQNGHPGEMTKAQALALWEYLLPRLKLRPVTSQPKAVSDARIHAPLGTLAVTGRVCPQTGWWECADDLNLAQAPGVWMQAGERMPFAQVWSQPNVWQRLKGERPRGELPAMWRLAAYELPAGASPSEKPAAPVNQPPAES